MTEKCVRRGGGLYFSPGTMVDGQHDPEHWECLACGWDQRQPWAPPVDGTRQRLRRKWREERTVNDERAPAEEEVEAPSESKPRWRQVDVPGLAKEVALATPPEPAWGEELGLGLVRQP